MYHNVFYLCSSFTCVEYFLLLFVLLVNNSAVVIFVDKSSCAFLVISSWKFLQNFVLKSTNFVSNNIDILSFQPTLHESAYFIVSLPKLSIIIKFKVLTILF